MLSLATLCGLPHFRSLATSNYMCSTALEKTFASHFFKLRDTVLQYPYCLRVWSNEEISYVHLEFKILPKHQN